MVAIEPIDSVKKKKKILYPNWAVPYQPPVQGWQGPSFEKIIFNNLFKINRTTLDNSENNRKDHNRELKRRQIAKEHLKPKPPINKNFNPQINLFNRQVAIIG